MEVASGEGDNEIADRGREDGGGKRGWVKEEWESVKGIGDKGKGVMGEWRVEWKKKGSVIKGKWGGKGKGKKNCMHTI